MVFEHDDYRAIIKAFFNKKNQERDHHSLRSFAAKLQISNSFLSQVLNKRRSFSIEQAFRISMKLNFTDAETQYFCLLVQLEQEMDPKLREEISARISSLNPLRPTHDLSVDIFKTISDWYYLAILELTYLSGFSLTSGSIAKRLKITKFEAESALERLLRLKLLEKSKTGQYRKTKSYLLGESSIPNEAFKSFHLQYLEKAAQSIQYQTPQERLSATDVVAIDSKYVKEVDRLSSEFSSAVIKLGEKSKVKDSVYALAVHFFRVNDPEGKI